MDVPGHQAIENGLHNNNSIQRESKTFEEAFEMTGHGRFNYSKLILGGLCLVGIIMESLESGYLLPVVECEFNMNVVEKGLLSSATFIGIVSSSHMWGYLADCKGRRGVMLPGIVMAVLCSVLSSFSPTAWFLILMRIFTGFFISSTSGAIFAYVGELHTDKERSKAIARVSIFISIAMMSLPAIGWVVMPQTWRFSLGFLGIEYASWRLFILICCIPNLVSAIWLYRSPESPKYLKAAGRYEEALEVLKIMYETNHNGNKFPVESLQIQDIPKAPEGFLSSLWNQTAPLFQFPLLPCILMSSFFQFTVFFLSSGLYLWFPDILNKLMRRLSLDPNNQETTVCEAVNHMFDDVEMIHIDYDISHADCTSQVSDTIFQVGIGMACVSLIIYMFIGFTVDKIGKKTLLVIMLVFPGLFTVGLFWADNVYLILSFYILLVNAGCAGGLVTSVAVDLFPTKLRGMAMSLSLMCGRIGAVVGANLAGYLFKTSCDSTFLIFGAEVLICAACTLLWPKPNIVKEKLAKKGIEF